MAPDQILQASVSKGGSALLFECESDGDTFVINHIAFERKVLSEGEEDDDEEDEDGSPNYTGEFLMMDVTAMLGSANLLMPEPQGL
jgi:hypothetical protein